MKTFEEMKRLIIENVAKKQFAPITVESMINSLLSLYDQSQWKAYPRNLPTPDILYYIELEDGTHYLEFGESFWKHHPRVIAFRELPPKFNKEE